MRALYYARFESLSRPSSLAAVTRRIPGKDLKQKGSSLRATPYLKVLTRDNNEILKNSHHGNHSQNKD